jgi:hypothetical protein
MSQTDFFNGVSRVVEFLGESALVARDRVKDHEAFDNYLIKGIREAMRRFLQSQNLTPEELQRLENKLSSLSPLTIKKTPSEKRRNPSRGISGNVNNALPMPLVMSLDEWARELVAERHKENPDETEAQAKAYIRAFVSAAYNPPKLVQVEPPKPEPYDLGKKRNELHALWREGLLITQRTSDNDWAMLAAAVGLKNLSSADVESIKSQIRSYEKRLKREKMRRNRKAD